MADAEITDSGKSQVFYIKIPFIFFIINKIFLKKCLKAKDFFYDIDVDLIFVSPLRRTIQTAINIFTNHKSNKKFVINEYMRERIISSCDIPQTFQIQ